MEPEKSSRRDAIRKSDSRPAATNGNVAQMTTRQLLRLYADILTELLDRGVVRSRNAPVGDLTEYLAARLYNGSLAAPSAKSWDVLSASGRRVQVKSRLIAAGDRKTHVYSPFRSWDFDVCLFVALDAHTYDIVQAVELPMPAVQALARESTWVRGFRVTTRTDLLAAPGSVDKTLGLRRIFDELDAGLPQGSG